jgi:hypothetical protein
MTTRPGHDEAAEYYSKYINQVPDGDIVETLERQGRETVALLRGISEDASRHSYAAGKWTIRQVQCHVNDCERLFVFRAMWFARGLESPRPSFDQDVAVEGAGADERSWASLVAEFDALRAASIEFFRTLPREAWQRKGIASNNPFTVRALAWITAGHVAHHNAGLLANYLTARSEL